jgi:hypothetical protein
MKIQLAHFTALTGIVSLLFNFRTGNAYDDSDFLREWKNAKGRNGRSLDGIFQDQNETAFNADESDVHPSIVGGVEVFPPRKYKVGLDLVVERGTLCFFPRIELTSFVVSAFLF